MQVIIPAKVSAFLSVRYEYGLTIHFYSVII